jgi:hypothetical protein
MNGTAAMSLVNDSKVRAANRGHRDNSPGRGTAVGSVPQAAAEVYSHFAKNTQCKTQSYYVPVGKMDHTNVYGICSIALLRL